MEADTLDVVEDVEEVCLDGVRVRRLAQDLQQGGVGDEEEARKQQPLLLQVAARQRNQPTAQYPQEAHKFNWCSQIAIIKIQKYI